MRPARLAPLEEMYPRQFLHIRLILYTWTLANEYKSLFLLLLRHPDNGCGNVIGATGLKIENLLVVQLSPQSLEADDSLVLGK